ncbi:MAG: DUF4129 domain-containing transglutaminase family protein, partial [Planctomycetota bacterium]
LIQNYLRREFIYSLDPPTVPRGVEPIEHFLTVAKTGHCEYFASSMTAMLRSLGIRARLVSGFRAQEYNAVGHYYVVRQSHAHAWVEAWSPDQTWKTYDPSPVAALDTTQLADVGFLASVRDLYEYVEFSWLNTFIAYDENQQDVFATYARDYFSRFTNAVQSMVQSVSNSAFFESLNYVPRYWKILLAAAAAPLLLWLLWLWYRDTRFAKRLDRRRKGEQRIWTPPRKLARELRFYAKMLQLLEKAGFSKPPWQPPAAFAQELTEHDSDKFDDVTHLTRIFYELRFGQKPLDNDRQSAIKRHMHSLRKAI